MWSCRIPLCASSRRFRPREPVSSISRGTSAHKVGQRTQFFGSGTTYALPVSSAWMASHVGSLIGITSSVLFFGTKAIQLTLTFRRTCGTLASRSMSI